MLASHWITAFFVSLGLLFFAAGSVGLMRFRDVYTRLHALTKVDNVGLGLVILGLCFQAEALSTIAVLFLVYMTVLASSTTSCHLIARTARRQGVTPWRGR
jgi:multicomponent Na+:H+ antiporter subunit G